jgi:hypothetical protein
MNHPFRSASVPPVEPPDPYEEALKKQLRRRKRTMITVYAMLVALPLGVIVFAIFAPSIMRLKYKLAHPEKEISADKKQAIAKELDSARTRAKDENKLFVEGIQAARAAHIGARKDLGACPIGLATPSQKNKPRSSAYGSYGAYGSMLPWETRAPFPYVRFLAPEVKRVDPANDGKPLFTAMGNVPSLTSLTSPTAQSILSEATSLDTQTKTRFREGDPSVRILRDATALNRRELEYDVVLVIDRYREPHGVPRAGFTAGYVAGDAYLWDFETRKVLCAGRVHAMSSENIEYEYRAPVNQPSLGGTLELAAALRDDLEAETQRAVVRALAHRAGPAAPTDEGVEDALLRLLDGAQRGANDKNTDNRDDKADDD